MKTRTLFAVTLALLAVPHLVIAIVANVPPLFGIAAAMLVAAALAATVDRWWAVLPGAIIAGVAAVHALAFYTALTHFDSGAEFSSVVSAIVLGVIGAALGITDLIARRRSRTSNVSPVVTRSFATAVAVLVAIAAASAVVTITSRDTVSASERANALVIDYKNTEVVNGDQPFTATANSGEIKIVVDNKDLAFHNFVMKEEDISLDLGPKESKLLTADLAPGTYTFKCTIAGHSAMTGTLIVQ